MVLKPLKPILVFLGVVLVVLGVVLVQGRDLTRLFSKDLQDLRDPQDQLQDLQAWP